MKNNLLFKLLSVFLLVFESVLYIIFILKDTQLISLPFGLCSDNLKYTSICLLFFFSVIFLFTRKNTQTLLLTPALLFTVAADYFLLFTASFIPGLIFFCIVQFFYAVLIRSFKHEKISFISVITAYGVRTAVCAVLLFLLRMILGRDAFTENMSLIIPGMFYGICFILNIIDSFCYRTPIPFRIGLILFLLCDICVLMRNLPLIFSFSPAVLHFFKDTVSFFMWVFYLPGKILIALSSIFYKTD